MIRMYSGFFLLLSTFCSLHRAFYDQIHCSARTLLVYLAGSSSQLNPGSFLGILRFLLSGSIPFPYTNAMNKPCIFCQLPAKRILAEDGPCLAFRDAFPVSEGHTLIIPRRHVASFRDLTPDEWTAAHRLAQTIAADLQAADTTITGFNFGANDGATAGQSIFHCHLHLIPRRAGDHPAPRGGIRGVIPGRADYPCPHHTAE